MDVTKQEELIAGLKRQDKAIISTLYDKYGDTLYGILLRIIPQEDIAQDVLQDSFVKIWKNGPSYDPKKGTLFTWMLNICRNAAIDKTRSAAYRRQHKTQAIDQAVHNMKAWSCEQKPDHIGLEQEVKRLEDKYRVVIELIYFQGYTQREIVDHLNIPLGTVKSRVRIGLRELRKIFKPDNVPFLLIIYLAEQFARCLVLV